jgi:hypothetical protein
MTEWHARYGGPGVVWPTPSGVCSKPVLGCGGSPGPSPTVDRRRLVKVRPGPVPGVCAVAWPVRRRGSSGLSGDSRPAPHGTYDPCGVHLTGAGLLLPGTHQPPSGAEHP